MAIPSAYFRGVYVEVDVDVVHTLMGDCGDGECILGWEIVGMKSANLGRSLRGWRVRTWVGGCRKGDSILRWEIVEM